VIGMSLALAGLEAVTITFFLLRHDLDANVRATRPANVEIEADELPTDTVNHLAALPGVTALDRRPHVALRVELAPGKWVPLVLSGIEDFTRQPLALFAPDSGAWPPPEGSLLIERDGRSLLADPAADHLHVRLPGGGERDLPLAGAVSDPAQHPSRMEMLIYGYASPATLAGWGLRPPRARLLLDASPEAFPAIEATLRADAINVRHFDAKPTAVYGHQFQIDAILAMLAAVALILGMLCVVLVFDLVNSLVTSERRSIGIQRALGARGWQIGLDMSAGIAALALAASLISLAPALEGGRALAGVVLGLMNFNRLSPIPPGLVAALIAGEIAVPLAIALLRLRPALSMPAREALSRADLAQGAMAAVRLAPLVHSLPPLARRTAWALASRPGRTLLSAAILSSGLAFFIVALDLRAAMAETRDALRRQTRFDLAVTLHEARPPAELDQWLQTVAGVTHADFATTDEAVLESGNSLPLLTLSDPRAIQPELLAGQWLTSDHPDDIAVNQALLKERPDLRLGGLYRLKDRKVRLAGIVREFGGPRILALGPADKPANLVLVSLAAHDFSDERAAAGQLDGPTVAQIIPARLTEAIVAGHLAPLTALMSILGGLALLVGVLGLASSLSVSVAERFREIGVMKAIGAPHRALFLLIAAESLATALLGWTIAALAAQEASRPLTAAFGSAIVGFPFDDGTDALAPIIALGIALAAALASASLPARAAMRASVSAALRL